MKDIYLLTGIPGSGKSTYIKKLYNLFPDSTVIISRDEIRFNLLGESEDYFSKETEVFNIFIEKINEAINNNSIKTIFIDATHLTEKARKRVLSQISLNKDDSLIALNFLVPLDVCLKQNEYRSGLTKVPRSVIRRMYNQYVPVRREEAKEYKYNYICDLSMTNNGWIMNKREVKIHE